MNVMVSVVVAVYNMEKYLRCCIDSVLRQTYDDYEIVLVNDGSKDSSEQIINEYISRYDSKIWKINKENGGLSSARNIALTMINGKYVTFLDADDFYDKDYLRLLVNKAETDMLDMVISGQHKITQEGKILNTIKYCLNNGKTRQRRLNISGKLYRTDYIRKWNITFPVGKDYEDNSFNLQAYFLSEKIGFIEYEGYYQVVHEGSITSKPITSSKLPFDEWEMVCQKVRDNANENVDKELFDFTFMSFLTYFLMVRNRKREYLSNENKEKSMDSIYEITDFCQKMIRKYFKGYNRNQYLNIFKNRELPFSQKIGSFVFWFCGRTSMLKLLVDVVYKLM